MEAMTRGDRTTRPGWGVRHPAIERVVEVHRPATSEENVWPNGVHIRVDAQAVAEWQIPEELVTSVRCITRVGDGIVVCATPNDEHIWPGGRREDGETFEQTAIREVHEETGWQLDPSSLEQLGFLHFEKLQPW